MIYVSDLTASTFSEHKSVISQLPQGNILGVTADGALTFLDRVSLLPKNLGDYLTGSGTKVESIKAPCRLIINEKYEILVINYKDYKRAHHGVNTGVIIEGSNDTPNHTILSMPKLLNNWGIKNQVTDSSIAIDAIVTSDTAKTTSSGVGNIQGLYAKVLAWDRLKDRDYNLVQILVKNEAYFIVYPGNYGRPLSELV